MCNTFRGSGCAVRRAEGVVHIEVATVCELPRERRIVRRLAGMKPRVLEHVEPVVRQQLEETSLDRSNRVLPAVFLRFRPTEMRADADLLRLPLEQQRERRQ